jgi:hypothetical protein
MFKRIAAIALLAFGSAQVSADNYLGFRDTYVTRTGDLNGDGRLDVYLDYTPKIIPIVLDDFAIPIPVKNTLADFVLLQNTTGGFTQSSVNSSQRNIMKQWAKQAAIELIFGDYNADGLLDILVKKIASAIPGVRDVIAFGPDTAGAMPKALRVMDGPFLLFMRDVLGWMENRAHYYDNAWQHTCVTTIVWIQVIRYSSEGVPYYSIEPGYLTQCGWVFDAVNYSVPGIYFLSAMYDPMEDREITRGSTNAQVISDILEGFLGTPFMRGILRTAQQEPPVVGPKPYVPDICQQPSSDPQTNEFCAQWYLSQIMAKILQKIGVYALNCGDSGFPASHHYELGAAVCNVGSPRCNVQEVYQNESLVHPVVGYWDQKEPIYNVAAGRWNPPAPLGWAALNCTHDVPGACDFMGFYDAGPIYFTVDPSVYWHRNNTMPGHIFHPGVINRSVYESGGKVHIYTIGEGTGRCPRTNESGGTQIFHTLNTFIACHLRGQCHVVHPVGQ